MEKETLQKKKKELEEKFKQIEENRQQALKIANDCLQELVRLQGAYAQLQELEKEFDDK